MRRTLAILSFVTAAGLMLPPSARAGECVTLTWTSDGKWGPAAEPAEPPAPLPVSGAICGLVSLEGQRNLALGLTLDLFDQGGIRVATVKLDSAAKFQFDRLPTGRYRIAGNTVFASILEGWIELTSPDQQSCRTPLQIDLKVAAECAQSHMSTTLPR